MEAPPFLVQFVSWFTIYGFFGLNLFTMRFQGFVSWWNKGVNLGALYLPNAIYGLLLLDSDKKWIGLTNIAAALAFPVLLIQLAPTVMIRTWQLGLEELLRIGRISRYVAALALSQSVFVLWMVIMKMLRVFN